MDALAKSSPDTEILAPCRSKEFAESAFAQLGFNNLKISAHADYVSIKEFNPEVVIHLAALSTSKNDAEAIESLIDSNIIYGVNLLNALADCTAMRLFVNTGSFAEYRKGIRAIDNAYLYSATKSAFRCFLDYYANLSGYKYITAVPYSVYGGKSKVKRIFDYMLESIGAFDAVSMTAGWQVLDFIHVDDICAFYQSTITDTNHFINLEQAREFHLGTGIGHDLHQIAELMEAFAGKKANINWGAIPYRDRDTMYAVAPISVNDNLWHAEISIKEGLEKYLKQNGY